MAPTEIPTDRLKTPPWPDTVDSIVEGEQYERDDLAPDPVTVTVENIREEEDGEVVIQSSHGGGQ